MVARKKVTLFVLVTILIMANVKADDMVKTDLKVGVVSANKIVGESREGIKTNTELMGKYKRQK